MDSGLRMSNVSEDRFPLPVAAIQSDERRSTGMTELSAGNKQEVIAEVRRRLAAVRPGYSSTTDT